MFLEYFVGGTFLPILSYYLKDRLLFEPFQVGLILAMPAVAALVAPFVAARVADRILSAEACLALCHLVGAALMFALSTQTRFGPFLVLYLVYALHFMPTYALTNTVALHHVPSARRDFARIRLWGTVAWVVAAWVFGYFWVRGGEPGAPSRLGDALVLSAGSSLVMGLYTLTLPRSGVMAQRRKEPPSLLGSLRLFARPSLFLLCVATFFVGLVTQFYAYGTAPFLSQMGLADEYIMPAMSSGQVTEIVMMGIFGVVLARIGMKRALLLGIVMQFVRFTVFATCPLGPSLAAVATHGICYTFFFLASFIYVDNHCMPRERAGAQQIMLMVGYWWGYLAGGLLAGKTAQWCMTAATGRIDYGRFWSVPSAISLVVLVVFAFLFREEPGTVRSDQGSV